MHSDVMSNRTNEIEQRLEQFRKSNTAILKTIAKRQQRLNASHNALHVRAVEKKNGGKLVETKRRSS